MTLQILFKLYILTKIFVKYRVYIELAIEKLISINNFL